MKILVTGGCGYIGSVLIPELIKLKHKIICVDNQWFGNFLPKHPNLKNLKMDMRNIDQLTLNGVDTIIHLASIANDPMAELDKNLSWETSALSTFKLMNQAVKYKVRRILYASSGSVYGIKRELKVHENLKLEPISLYNKVKMITERIILSYGDSIEKFIIRPATVCGFSPRMRYDVTVNALSFSAIKNKVITVFGGKQVRPNIHIDDMVDLYIYLIKAKKKHQGIYNAGFENESIINIAKEVKKNINSKIIINSSSNDPRSYRLDSTKLLKIGFKNRKSYKDAIIELKYRNFSKELKDNPKFHSVKWLKKLAKLNKIN